MDRILGTALLHLEISVGNLLEFAVLPIAKVLVLCGFGLAMASRYINILPAHSRRLLSKLVFSLFLPCLIFTQLGKAVSVEKILQWWFIPVNIILGAFLGCLIGYVMALIVKPPPQFFNFFIIMIGIGKQARWFWIPKPLMVSTNIKDFFLVCFIGYVQPLLVILRTEQAEFR
jgi:hypothetical protein